MTRPPDLCRPLSVEFFGPPAAGKSTLARIVAGQLRADRVAVRQPIAAISHGPGRGPRTVAKTARKLRLVAGELLGWPAASLRAIRDVIATRQRTTGLWLRMAFHWLLIRALLRRPSRSAAVRLFDQGLFQALWSVALEARRQDPARLRGLLESSAPLPDVVVVLDVGLETVRRRLESRQGRESRADRWRNRDPHLVARCQGVHAEVAALIESLRREHGRPLIVRVNSDSDSDLEGNARRVTAAIESLVTPGSPPSRRAAAPRD